MRRVLRSAVLAAASSGVLYGQFHLPGTGSKPDAPAAADTKPNKASKSAPSVAAPVQVPGRFDYYLLSLSSQPGRVVVLGFAPRLNQGANPESCGSAKPASKGAIGIAASLMANRTAVQDEWLKHGSCTGLKAVEYFNTMRFARSLVQIPVQLTSAEEDGSPETPQLIQAQFVSANSGFPAGAFRTEAQAVQVCFDLQLKPQACPTGSK